MRQLQTSRPDASQPPEPSAGAEPGPRHDLGPQVPQFSSIWNADRSQIALLIASAGVGLAASLLVAAVVAAVRPATGEPLALRWLRTWAEHPLRCALAVALLTAALSGSGRPWRGSAS